MTKFTLEHVLNPRAFIRFSSCKCENLSESTDWWEPEALWVRGDYICTLFSPFPHCFILLPSFTVLLSLYPLFSYPFSHLISFLSFPFLSSPHLSLCPRVSSLGSSPSTLLQSLACCLVHATGRSGLTDGWMARAEAIRHWAEWNRTGPVHYQDSRLCLIFNLYFPGAGWQRTHFMFEQNPVPLCFRSAVTFWICLCSFSSAGHLSHFGKVKYHQRNLCFFFPSPRPDKCLLRKQTLIENVTTSYETRLLLWCGLHSQYCVLQNIILVTARTTM